MFAFWWFFKAILKQPYTTVWFPEEICLIFDVSDIIGRMPKLINRYLLETDDFSNNTRKNPENNCKGILPTVFLYTISPLGTTSPISSRLEIFSKITFCEKPTQMHTTQYLDLFVNDCGGFNMNTGKKNPIVVHEILSFSEQPSPSPLVLDSVNIKTTFLHWMIQIAKTLSIIHR